MNWKARLVGATTSQNFKEIKMMRHLESPASTIELKRTVYGKVDVKRVGLRLFAPLVLILLVFSESFAAGQSVSDISDSGAASEKAEIPNKRQKSPSFTEMLDSVGKSFTNNLRRIIRPEEKPDDTWNSNGSPRETVFTFYRGMDAFLYHGRKEEDRKRVAKTLPEGFAPDGEEALALKAIFDRLGEIPNIVLPSDKNVEDGALNEFEVFPYALDHAWIWEYTGSAPEGSIVVVRSGERWKFDTETLRGAPRFLESIRQIPPVYPSSRGEDLLDQNFGSTIRESPWWSWLILLGSIVLACFAGYWIRKMLMKAGDRLGSQVATVLGNLISGLALSVSIMAGVVIVVIGSSYVEFSPFISETVWLFVRVVLLIAAVGILLTGIDLIVGLIRRKFISDSSEYREMSVTMVQRIVRSVVILILLFFILQRALGIHIGALITGLGVVGLALSLAGKESASNLFGAVSIFINRPFVVGDWIEFNGSFGVVRDVRMQATHVRLLSGEMMIIPNQQFVSKSVNNLGLRKYIRREMDIAVPYSTSAEQMDRAIDLLNDILRSDDIVAEGKCNIEERPPQVSFSSFGDYYLNLKAYYWYFVGNTGEELERNHERGWFSYLNHCTLVNRAILSAFNDNGIEFAFPTQTIELEQDSEKRKAKGKGGNSDA